MNEPNCRGGITASLTKVLAALANHLDHLTTQHQHNSGVLLDALEEREIKAGTKGEDSGTSVVENVSLIQAYQGLDAMEQRLHFLRNTIHSVNELVQREPCENYPATLDELMLTLAKNSPVTTDGLFYSDEHENEMNVVEFKSHTEVKDSVILFDDDEDKDVVKKLGRGIEQ